MYSAIDLSARRSAQMGRRMRRLPMRELKERDAEKVQTGKNETEKVEMEKVQSLIYYYAISMLPKEKF